MLIPTEYLTGNIDIAKTPLEYVIAEEGRIEVMLNLLRLSPREERVIRLRFWYGLTLREVGELYGVTLERIRHLEAKSLRRLKYPDNSRKLRPIISDGYHSNDLPARHYVPEWKRNILAHVNRFRYRDYYDFDLRRFLQGKMSTKEMMDYFATKQ